MGHVRVYRSLITALRVGRLRAARRSLTTAEGSGLAPGSYRSLMTARGDWPLALPAFFSFDMARVRQRPMLAGIVQFDALLEMVQRPREVAPVVSPPASPCKIPDGPSVRS